MTIPPRHMPLSLREPPALSLGDFSLRALRQEDAHAWFSYLAKPEVTRNTGWGFVDSPRIQDLVRRLISDYETRTSWRWAVARNVDGRLIGTCGLTAWSLAQQRAQLVYDLNPSYWRRGIMKRAVKAVVAWAFTDGGINRLEALVPPANIASLAVLESCSFLKEGLLRQYLIVCDEPRDFYIYSLLRSEEHGISDDCFRGPLGPGSVLPKD